VINKIFVTDNDKEEVPHRTLPPPYPHPLISPGSFLVLQPRIHKLTFPTFDSKEDPLPWLNRCEQFFRGQKMPDTEQVWYASFHLTGGAQQWNMRLTQDKALTNCAYFA
jgi:hypothetical protein